MNISKYYLSDYAKTCMFDRHRILGPPIVTSIGSTLTCDSDDSLLNPEADLITNQVLDSKFSLLQNKLIIGFVVDESMFSNQHNGLVIDFPDELSVSQTSSYRSPVRIFIDNISLYGGIIEANSGESLDELRLKYGQLKLGYNTLILENVFSCQFVFDEIIENDLPNTLDSEGKIPLNSINELKVVYPYFKQV